MQQSNAGVAPLQDLRPIFVVFETPQMEELAEVRIILAEQGGLLGSYIPDNAVNAIGSPAALSRINALESVSVVSL